MVSTDCSNIFLEISIVLENAILIMLICDGI